MSNINTKKPATVATMTAVTGIHNNKLDATIHRNADSPLYTQAKAWATKARLDVAAARREAKAATKDSRAEAKAEALAAKMQARLQKRLAAEQAADAQHAVVKAKMAEIKDAAEARKADRDKEAAKAYRANLRKNYNMLKATATMENVAISEAILAKLAGYETCTLAELCRNSAIDELAELADAADTDKAGIEAMANALKASYEQADEFARHDYVELPRVIVADNKYKELRDTVRIRAGRIFKWLLENVGEVPFVRIYGRVQPLVGWQQKVGAFVSDYNEAIGRWKRLVLGGVVVNGENYIVLFKGPNDANGSKAWAVKEGFIKSDLGAKFMVWLDGFSSKDHQMVNAIAKIGYRFLENAADQPMEDIGNTPFNVDQLCLIPDAYIEIEVPAYFVSNGGNTVRFIPKHKIRVNAFDGMMVIEGKTCCSVRAKVIKGMGVAVKDIDAFGVDMSRSIVGDVRKINVYDADGNVIGQEDHVMMLGELIDIDGKLWERGTYKAIACESVWKTNKSCYPTYASYVKACQEVGDVEVRALLVEHHDKLANMPYQQLQSLWAADTSAFAKYEVEYLRKKAALASRIDILPRQEQIVCRAAKSFLNSTYINEKAEESYQKLLEEAMTGTVHELCHNAFVAADLIAFGDWAFRRDEEYIRGSLYDGEVYIADDDVDEVVISRNPCTDANLVRTNVHDCEIAKYVSDKTTTVFVSIFDALITEVRGDYDGDHVKWSNNAVYLAAAKQHYANIGGEVVFDWDTESAAKVAVTAHAILEYFATEDYANGSQLGHYMNCLSKLISELRHGMSKADTEQALREMAVLVYAVNVLVDAGKHGGQAVQLPLFVSKLAARKMPWFKSHDYDYFGGNVDEFVAYVQDRVPAHIEVSDVVCDDLSMFRGKMGNHKHIIGLFNVGDKDNNGYFLKDKNGHYVNQGVFQKDVKELGRLIRECEGGRVNLDGTIDYEDDDARETNDNVRYCVNDVRKHIMEVARAIGCTENDAIDTIIDGFSDVKQFNLCGVAKKFHAAQANPNADPAYVDRLEGVFNAQMMELRAFIRIYAERLAYNAVVNSKAFESLLEGINI